MRRTRKNPGEDSTLLLLAAAGVAVYGYLQGWFASWGFAPAATATTSTATTAAAPAPTVAAPPLGTPATSTAQVAAQAAANDLYILPGSSGATVPSGYVTLPTSDQGTIFVLPSVSSAVATWQATATGQAATATGPISFGEVQSLITSAGLNGLGQYRQYIATRTGRWR